MILAQAFHICACICESRLMLNIVYYIKNLFREGRGVSDWIQKCKILVDTRFAIKICNNISLDWHSFFPLQLKN